MKKVNPEKQLFPFALIGHDYLEIARAVGMALESVRQLNYKGKDVFGYFTLIDSLSGQVAFVGRINIGPKDKSDLHMDFSREKAERLFSHKNHVSSWQSRNPDLNRYGGAIRLSGTKQLVMSFSGLFEEEDEAIVMMAAEELGWLDPVQTKKILDVSGNRVFKKIR